MTGAVRGKRAAPSRWSMGLAMKEELDNSAEVRTLCEDQWHNKPLRSANHYVGWTTDTTIGGDMALVCCKLRKVKLKDIIGPRLRKLLGWPKPITHGKRI